MAFRPENSFFEATPPAAQPPPLEGLSPGKAEPFRKDCGGAAQEKATEQAWENPVAAVFPP
jgi:hypothetical protein